MTRVALDCRVVSHRIDGLGRYTFELARALARRPDALDLTFIVPATLDRSHPLQALMDLGVKAVQSREPAMSVRSLVSVLPTLRRLDVDLYHYPHFNLPLVAISPVVITLHDMTPLTSPDYFERRPAAKRAFFRLATAYALTRAAAIITPSRATEADVLRTFPWVRGRTHVIYEGVHERFRDGVTPEATARLRATQALVRPFILYVGVARPHKNLPRLLRAFASIAARIPHDLALAGQSVGDIDRLRAVASDLGIGDRVRWLGYVGQGDLPPLYACADAFALCSLREGFGLGIIEAMACGTPVAASNVGAAAEVAGGAAELVDPLSVDSIAAGLLRICTDMARREELRALGLARAATFTWERTAAATVLVYRAAARAR